MKENEYSVAKLRIRQALPLEDKIAFTRGRVRAWYTHWCGSVYIALSGGKDSCVMADIIWKDYPEVPAVFADTGNELDSVVEHINSMIADGKPITIVKPKMSFEEIVKKHGYPVVSKLTCTFVNDMQRPAGSNDKTKHLRMTGITSTGKKAPTMKLAKKWRKLIDAPFAVTNKCCGILKYNPTSPYRKETGRKPFVGVMAGESMAREMSYINSGGCNAFDQSDPVSRPIMFWTEQDILQYIKKNNLPIASAYGSIITNSEGKLTCSGQQRTGCKFCLFGVHLEKGENRIQRLARIEPESYKKAIDELGYDKVMDFLGVDWRPVNDLFARQQKEQQ